MAKVRTVVFIFDDRSRISRGQLLLIQMQGSKPFSCFPVVLENRIERDFIFDLPLPGIPDEPKKKKGIQLTKPHHIKKQRVKK